MQKMNEQAAKNYHVFKNEYEELMKLGEDFLKIKIFNSVRIEKFTEMKDGAKYYVYRHFPELYGKYFITEPQLPRVSFWHYVLNHVLWMSDKLMNRVWWPKYGAQVEEYMNYYMERFKAVVDEIEGMYEVPEVLPETEEVKA